MTAAAAKQPATYQRRYLESAPPLPRLSDTQCAAIASVYCAARAEYARQQGRRTVVMQFASMSETGKAILLDAIRTAWENQELRSLKPGEQIADWRETALLHRITHALTGVPIGIAHNPS